MPTMPSISGLKCFKKLIIKGLSGFFDVKKWIIQMFLNEDLNQSGHN